MNLDCRKLGKIYLQLKELEAELLEIELRHETHQHFKQIILDMIEQLDRIAHTVIFEAKEIKDDKNGETGC